MNDKIRKEFEQWRDESPNQRYGNAVQEAWYAGRESMQDTTEETQPINPDEVYSPNTIVIDDKCRKCAGQMRDGKAIAQTSVGVPDFAGGAIVTMSPGGSGKMIECRKCSDCGWSVGK